MKNHADIKQPKIFVLKDEEWEANLRKNSFFLFEWDGKSNSERWMVLLLKQFFTEISMLCGSRQQKVQQFWALWGNEKYSWLLFMLSNFTETSRTCTYLQGWEIIPFEKFIAFVLLWICWNDTRKNKSSSRHFRFQHHHFSVRDKCEKKFLFSFCKLANIFTHAVLSLLRWHVGI